MNGLRKCGMCTQDIMSSEVIQVQKDKGHMWKVDPKDKSVYKKKHDHIHIYIEKMFVMVELLYDTRGKREKKRK
jgi:hypothetical protein